MNPEQMRKRLAEISAELKNFEGVESYSDEELSTITALSEESETLTKQLEAREKLERAQASLSAPVRKTPPAPVENKVTVVKDRSDKMGGFNSIGDFMNAVKNQASGNTDKRFLNTMYERNAEEGGFLVPEELGTDIQKVLESSESLLSKTRSFTTSSNNLTLPIDEAQPWNNGVTAYWLAEGAPYIESKFKFGSTSWKLHKLGVLVKATDELLEDATALESYIRTMAPQAIMHKINAAILGGDGVGKPQGILNSGFKIKVAKEVGQAADTVTGDNVIAMYAKMLPASRARAVWFANAGVEEALLKLKDGQGNYLYLAPGSPLNQAPYGLLMGRPVYYMMDTMQALGDEGDLVFADLSYYISLTKGTGVKSAVSTHVYFERDITAFKFSMRIDGKCPFTKPVSTEFGGYQRSGIITLEERA